MIAVLRKELTGFLFSPVSYITAILYAACCGLFVWVFRETSVLSYGYADLDIFFRIIPFIYIFLIPALTMRLFAEERRLGILDLLFSKPISIKGIVWGKFIACLLFTIFINFFLSIYVYSIYSLGDPVGNIDLAATGGACIGLFFTSGLFVSFGIFSSAISKNQITAYLIGVFLCFIFQIGFTSLAELFEGFGETVVLKLSMSEHYKLMQKGVVVSEDVLYFVLLSIFFLILTIFKIGDLRRRKSLIIFVKQSVVLISFLLLLFLPKQIFGISWGSYKIDLTGDSRFSLSESTKKLLGELKFPLTAEVYLTGELPPGFKRLEERVQEALQNLHRATPKGIRVKFLDPTAEEDPIKRDRLYSSLVNRGIVPLNVIDKENDGSIQKLVFPFLTFRYGGNEAVVPLLQGNSSMGAENTLNQSAEALEYELISALKKITHQNRKKIVLVRGHDEAEGTETASFRKLLHERYDLRTINLDSTTNLSEYAAIIILKPKKGFSEMETFVLNHYLAQGGNLLFFIDPVRAEIDSIGEEGFTALPYLLELDDFFFRCGFKVPPVLLSDLYCTEIPLYVGQAGNSPQIVRLPWPYWPVINRFGKHPVVKNMGPLSLKFSGIIDTAVRASEITKIPLLYSSDYSKVDPTPAAIHFDELKRGLNPKEFSVSSRIVALLAEGQFKSPSSDRLSAGSRNKEILRPGKVFICVDADIALNEIDLKTGMPLQLGANRYNPIPLANAYFLNNLLDFMTAPDYFTELKSREIVLRLLDKGKIRKQKAFYLSLNIGVPLLLILLLGITAFTIRKKRYS